MMNKYTVLERVAAFFQELSKEGAVVHSFNGDWIDASTWEGRKFRLTNARIDVEIYRGLVDEDN